MCDSAHGTLVITVSLQQNLSLQNACNTAYSVLDCFSSVANS